MWKIEELIKDNKGQFETDEPQEGHQQRFLMRLEKQAAQQKKSVGMSMWYGVAASLVLLLSVVWLTLEPFKSSRASSVNKVTAIQISPELNQVLSYYNNQVEQEADELTANSKDNEHLTEINDAARLQMEKLDAQLMSIEKEYQKNPGNESVKAALVNTQRKKAEIVECLNDKSRMATQGYRVGEPFTQF